jgi:hypothetical protein
MSIVTFENATKPIRLEDSEMKTNVQCFTHRGKHCTSATYDLISLPYISLIHYYLEGNHFKKCLLLS